EISNLNPTDDPTGPAGTGAPAQNAKSAGQHRNAPQPSDEAPTGRQPIKMEPRGNDANASPFSVIVGEVYDGPLDLLLDLIRKQDIDIYDIPIAKITAQFLAYV